MKQIRLLAVSAFVSVFLSLPLYAAEHAPCFPFVVSYDAPKDGVNMSFLLHAPAGKHGFVRVEGDKFVTDAGEIRFWATNFSGGGNFPEKKDADKIADRLARFGFNCVRLHALDAIWDSNSIWGPGPKSLRRISPTQLDKLDYLFAALKKRGIYANFNLHVARWLDDRDGFPHRAERPTYDKGLDNFDPRMIELQKEYARDLLGHVNPYTGLAYADDPALAMVEINNENSVVIMWHYGALDGLPDPYAAEFRKQWNDWLRKKYGSTDAMLRAWGCVDSPLGEEMIPGGDFTAPVAFDGRPWALQSDDNEQVDCRAVPEEKLLRMIVRRDGKVSWTPQLRIQNLKLEKGKPYTLSFRIRCDQPSEINAGVSAEGAGNSIYARFPVASEWKTCHYIFFGASDSDKGRLAFTGMKAGTVELADLTLRPGGKFGFKPDRTLEAGMVPTMKKYESHLSEAFRRDAWQFVIDLEWKYWPVFARFLKEELKVKAPISGTQIDYGEKHVQAALDYCDDHVYWNHPIFPSKPWDKEDWFVRNRALVNFADAELYPKLGTRRIAGKPYTLSEYNHPYPNRYAAEGLPMTCAFAGFQGWNGVFQYHYAFAPGAESGKIDAYFDMINQPGQMVHAPACAAILLRGDVDRAKRTILGPLDKNAEWEALMKYSPRDVDFRAIGLDPRLTLLYGTALDLTGRSGTDPKTIPAIPEDRKVFRSDTEQLTWNLEEKDAGYFTLDTPNTKLFTGFIRGRTFKIGNVELSFGRTRLDWATVSMTKIAEGRYLLAATGWMENTDMKPEKYADDDSDRLTLRRNWGKAPILCEGIPFTLTFPAKKDSVKGFALDPQGRPKQDVPVSTSGSTASVDFGPKYETLWYEIAF